MPPSERIFLKCFSGLRHPLFTVDQSSVLLGHLACELFLVQVLLALARSGHPSSHLDVLVNAAGDAAGHEGPQLLEMLTPTDAGKLLMCLEQIIEEGGLLAEEVEGDEED